jgi:hypothetical protein
MSPFYRHLICKCRRVAARPALVCSLLLFTAPLATAQGEDINQTCQSLLGSPPMFTMDNAYYCMSWNKGLLMQGAYGAGNNTFGARGQTHAQTMTVNTSTFPDGTSWSWKWPAPQSCCLVDSFYALYWGTSGYAVSAPSPPAPEPVQLGYINRFTQILNLAYADNGGAICIPPNYGTWTSNIDIIDDIFLFGNPNPHAKYSPLFEIAIAFHDGPPQSSKTTYTISENDRTWTGYEYPPKGERTWTLWYFTTGSDVLSGTVDLRIILQSLVTHRYADGNEWLLGVPLGSEVWCGSGGLTINSISYQLQRR